MADIADLEHIYQDIEEHFENHLSKVQEFLKTPCFSTENYGVRKCANYLKDILDKLGFNSVELIETKINPYVYGEFDAGADHTLLVYAKYDNVGVNVENWTYDPFEAPIVEKPPYGKVIYARGSCGGHSEPRAFLNSLESILKITGNLPINLLFIAEGEEEIGSPSFPWFINKYQDRLKRAEALISPGAAAQNEDGVVRIQLSGPGYMNLELECSGERWGYGPTKFDIHSANSNIVESPLWRMIKALGTMISDDGNDVLIEGFYDDVIPPTPEEDENLEELSKNFNIQKEMETRSILRFANNETNPKSIMKRILFRPSMCVGDLTTRSAVVLHRVTANVNLVLKPKQDPKKMIEVLRTHLDSNGFSDISIKYLGGWGWWKTDPNHRLVKAVIKGYQRFGINPEIWLTADAGEPFANFSDPPLNLPCVGNVALAHGAGGHAPNEYVVVEGKKPYMGLRELEKSYAAILYEYANI